MARSFDSIGAFVAFMEARVASLPAAERQGMDRGSAILLEEAKWMPGHYQSGWPKLQQETVARKRTGDSPLLETGGLRDSYARKVVGPREAVVGSNDEKAVWQEMGTSRGIPPRPVLAAAGARKGREAAEAVGRAIGAHMAGGSNR